jgi:hypothetical protein
MGFALYYRSTRPVGPAEFEALHRDALAACQGRTWLSCEPVAFFPGGTDGHLFGASKPNFQPHPDDEADAARSGLPDGTTSDLIAILCQLSRDHGVDWEFSHDASNGPIGEIRAGVCDEQVLDHVELFADLGDVISGDLEGLIDEEFA